MDQQTLVANHEFISNSRNEIKCLLENALIILKTDIPDSAIRDFCEHNINKAIRHLNDIRSKKELIDGNGNSEIPK